MKRRLDLASALVHRPGRAVPRRADDRPRPRVSRLTVWEEVRRINQLGTTVFLTTQYLEEADQLCDRLAIIDDGVIVREGTPASLKAELRARTGAPTPTLDDVFLDATGRTRARRRRRRAGGVVMSHAWVLGQRALREAWRTPDALVPTLVHPAVLPRRQRRPGGQDLPGRLDRVPQGPGLRRVPVAAVAAARRVVRHRGAVPGRGDRGRLLRQAARDADPAHRDRPRPADRRVHQGPADRHRDHPARRSCSGSRSRPASSASS